MIQEITEAVLSLLTTWDSNKFNISLGFFDGYATVESDLSGKRFCNAILANKDSDGNDISALDVPLVYIGSQLFVNEFKLVSGDELLVFFTDRTLESWKPTSGTVPQITKNPVKDSLNHAIAIPVNTHHYDQLVLQKLDMLNMMNRILGAFLGDLGPFDTAGSASSGTINQTPVINELTAIRNSIQAAIN